MLRTFVIDEGQLSVPSNWHDQSLNVLVDKTTGPGFSLTISRDRIPWGMSFDGYVEQEFSKIARSLNEFSEKERAQVNVSGVDARAMAYQWKANIGVVDQILVIVPNGEKALIFTGSNPTEMNSEQKKKFIELVRSFNFRRSA
jgi:hypothetical protein